MIIIYLNFKAPRHILHRRSLHQDSDSDFFRSIGRDCKKLKDENKLPTIYHLGWFIILSVPAGRFLTSVSPLRNNEAHFFFPWVGGCCCCCRHHQVIIRVERFLVFARGESFFFLFFFCARASHFCAAAIKKKFFGRSSL